MFIPTVLFARISQQNSQSSLSETRKIDRSNKGTCSSSDDEETHKSKTLTISRLQINGKEEFELNIISRVTHPNLEVTTSKFKGLSCYKITKKSGSESYMCQQYVNQELSLLLNININIDRDAGDTKIVLNTKAKSKKEFAQLDFRNNFRCDLKNIITTDASEEKLTTATAAGTEEFVEEDNFSEGNSSSERNVQTLRDIVRSQFKDNSIGEGATKDPNLEEGGQGRLQSANPSESMGTPYERDVDPAGNILLFDQSRTSRKKVPKVTKVPVEDLDDEEGSPQ